MPTWSSASARDGNSLWAIVLTDFPFTDLTAAKRRPALVISTDNDRRTDVIVAYITSAPRKDSDAMTMAPTAGTGLKVVSSVRFDKIATINKSIIAGRIGDADPVWLRTHARSSSGYSGSAAPCAKARWCSELRRAQQALTVRRENAVTDSPR